MVLCVNKGGNDRWLCVCIAAAAAAANDDDDMLVKFYFSISIFLSNE